MRRDILTCLTILLLSLTCYSQNTQTKDSLFLIEAWRLKTANLNFVLLDQALEDIAVYQNKSIIDAQTIAKLDSIQTINSQEIVALRLANELKQASIRSFENSLNACEESRNKDIRKATLIGGLLSFGLLTTLILYVAK